MKTPVLLGHGRILDDATTKRVQDFVARIGLKKAVERLHVSDATLQAAAGRSRLRDKTIDRLLTALEREEVAS